ncbi:hypothetical protein B0A55_00243 [Friedmanniomyces simplex]|uniref:Uncharacterized protein n=1 Tax=Friedmanniomyces simplex TaxID=329884 RepID=A0A4U0Y427_9PEZI|nr:hypothetical protein B0A55_00243 [Friedmanniomyces simplex]
MRRILEMSGGLGAVGDGLGDGVEGAGCGGRDGGGVEGFGSGGSGGWGIAGLEYGLQREEEGEDRVHREKEEGGDVDKEQEGEVDVDKAAEGEEEAVAQFSDDNTQVAGTDDDEHAEDDNDHVSPRESHREKEKEKEEKDDSIPLDLGPSIPRDNDDDSLPTSSRTLLVDERDGPGGGRGSRADDERSVASSGLREMGRRGRRYAFGAACVEDLESEGEGVDGGAAVGGSGEGADAGPPSDGAGGGGSARVSAKVGGGPDDGPDDGSSNGADAGPSAGRGLGARAGPSDGLSAVPSVLETVRQLQNLDYTSSSGSSGAAASVHREIPTRTHNLGLSRFGVNARAATEGGPRRPFRGLRHRPGIADFSGPLENLAARSQSIDLDDSIPTPDTGILAEVNGSPSDENLENLEPLSLQRTGSSKYRPKSKGKESVHDDPEEVHDETVATASAEPTGPISPQREQRQPVGHQPESSRDALANAAAEPTSPQSQPSPLPRRTHIRGGPRDNGARDPGHWSLDPRHDSTTNTAAEEATRMTIEWLQNSDAEGSSPVDRHGAPKQDWEVRLRNPLP